MTIIKDSMGDIGPEIEDKIQAKFCTRCASRLIPRLSEAMYDTDTGKPYRVVQEKRCPNRRWYDAFLDRHDSWVPLMGGGR